MNNQDFESEFKKFKLHDGFGQSEHFLDDDIKNELLELADQVSQTFSQSNKKQENSSCSNDKNNMEINSYESLNGVKNKFELNNVKSDLENNYFNENNYNDDDNEFKLPVVDWENLEAKLKEAQKEINNQVFKILFISIFFSLTQ